MRLKLVIFHAMLFSLIITSALNSYAGRSSGKIDRLFEKSRIQYQNGDLSLALTTLNQVLKIDSTYCNGLLLKADIVNELRLNVQEIETLQSIQRNCKANNQLLLTRLGNAFFASGNYTDAAKSFQTALNECDNSEDSYRLNHKIKCCSFSMNQLDLDIDIPIQFLDSTVNTEKEEYWPVVSSDGETLYFNRLEKNRFGLMSEDFFASKLIDGIPKSAHRLSEPINSVENEGAMSVTADGKMIFFTACSRKGGKGKCDIYVTIKKNGKWLSPINLKGAVNTALWETQPSVSADGNILYFVSNRSGGKGKKDIWMARRVGFDQIGFPIYDFVENLGDSINTREDDYSPFIHADDVTLYFASTGHVGMGGADLYISRNNGDGFTSPKNLGKPINTRFNEDGLVVSAVSTESYFVSDRVYMERSDKNIIKVDLPEWMLPFPVSYVKGSVYDASTNQRIAARVTITDLEDGEVLEFNVDGHDGYLACLKQGKQYAMEVIAKGYMMYSQHFNLTYSDNIRDAMQIDVHLQPVSIGETITLNNIFFEFDSYEINSKSEIELDQIIRFIKENPGVIIEISGHTDNKGSKEYNQKLSESRAREVYQFLSEKVDADVLRYNGYGDELPIKSNETEAGRQANRRTELKIIDIQTVDTISY